MKYDFTSVTKFGNKVKDLLTAKSLEMINKYKEASSSSVFDKKVEQNVTDKETD